MKRTYEVTLIQALSECYTFNPRKKIGSEILFEAVFYDKNKKEQETTIRFEKQWDKFDHDWTYLEGQTYCPMFGCSAQHFVSNLFAYDIAKEQMIYGAQQGDFHVFRLEAD